MLILSLFFLSLVANAARKNREALQHKITFVPVLKINSKTVFWLFFFLTPGTLPVTGLSPRLTLKAVFSRYQSSFCHTPRRKTAVVRNNTKKNMNLSN